MRVLLNPAEHADVDEWRRAVNREVGDLLHADQRTFVLPDGGPGPLLTDDFTTAEVALYRSAFPTVDRRFGLLDRARRAGVTSRRTTWGRHVGHFYRSAYYNEVLVPIRAFDNLSLILEVGLPAPVQLIFNHARSRGRRFGHRERALLALLQPAAEAGVRAVLDHRARRGGAARMADVVDAPACLVTRRGHIVHRNGAAARLLDSEAGRRAGAADRVRWQARSAGVAAAGSAPPMTVDDRTLEWAVVPVEPGGSGGGLVLVMGSWTDPPSAAARFGLTPREEEVAALLAARRTNREIAEALDVSPHTARHHTEHVFDKLGVRSRREVKARLGPG